VIGGKLEPKEEDFGPAVAHAKAAGIS